MTRRPFFFCIFARRLLQKRSGKGGLKDGRKMNFIYKTIADFASAFGDFIRICEISEKTEDLTCIFVVLCI